LTLTNVTLATPTWEYTDPAATGASQRYYRARLPDFAPDALAGKTVVATVTNLGPIVVTLADDASTFTQLDPGPQSGTYTYTNTGPVLSRCQRPKSL
jgi:hypothetical protein